MKTLFRVLALGIFLTASSVLTFAQEPDLPTLYAQFRTELKAKCGDRGAALATGKKVIAFGNDPKNKEVADLNKEVIAYVTKETAKIETEDPACRRNNAYNDNFKVKNWAGVFSSGKEVIAAEGDSGVALDVMLDLVSVGFDRAAVDKIDTFNADTLNFAKTALQKIQSGKTSQTGKYGVFVPFNTKDAAQSWLNYIIGWQMYYKLNQQKEALPYFYKATQISNEKKNDTSIYTNIGKYYFDEAVRIFEEYTTKRNANNKEDNDETKALLALSRGYADRASDAFGRAYKVVPAGTAKTAIAKTLSDLYKFRFNLADAKQADVDKYIQDLVAKPMPDPATAVTPVVEEVKPTTTTTSTTSTTTPTTTVSNTANTTKTKETPATTTATTTKTTKTTTVKKPVTKKKGTR